jgi:hypothetical protein
MHKFQSADLWVSESKKLHITHSMEGRRIMFCLWHLSNVSQEFHSALITSDIKAINNNNKMELSQRWIEW